MDAVVSSQNPLGKFLRNLRSSQRSSLSGLAARAGIAKSTLSKWESGQFLPRLPELNAILDVLAVSPAERRRAIEMVNAPRTIVLLRREAERAANKAGVEFATPPGAGDLLKAMRLRRGRTADEVARAIGVSVRSVRSWERSEAWPAAGRLHQLCFLLGAAEEEMSALAAGPLLNAPLPLSAASSEEEISNYLYYGLSHAAYHAATESLRDLSYLALEAAVLPRTLHRSKSRELLGEIYVWYAQWLGNNGRYRESARYADRGMALARRERRSDLMLLAALASTRASVLAAEPNALAKHAAKANETLRDLLSGGGVYSPGLEAWALERTGAFLRLEGRTEDALASSAQSVAVAARDVNSSELQLRRFDHAELLMETGRATEALSFLPSGGFDETERPSLRVREALIRVRVLLRTGNASEAHDWLASAYRLAQTYELDTAAADALAARF